MVRQVNGRWVFIANAAMLLGCGKAEPATSGAIVPPATDAIGAKSAVPTGTVTLGFYEGRLRAEVSVPGFQISSYPVAQSQYEACVSAGACEAANAALCGAGAAMEAIPAAEALAPCVGVTNAERFCSWLGGRLPSIGEWMLAARGPAVARYPWGNSSASCEQHPAGSHALSHEEVATLERSVQWPGELREAMRRAGVCSGDDTKFFRLRQHPAGASPYGLEDVLLSPGELVTDGPGNPYNSCHDASGTCVVQRNTTGVISSTGGLSRAPAPVETSDSAGSAALAPYAFRCVWP